MVLSSIVDSSRHFLSSHPILRSQVLAIGKQHVYTAYNRCAVYPAPFTAKQMLRSLHTASRPLLNKTISTIETAAKSGDNVITQSLVRRTLLRARSWLLRLSVVGISVMLIDSALNDDLDRYSGLFRSRVPEAERKKRPKVVVIGAGWGALNMLRKLHCDEFDVTVVAKRNYFVFTPLLPNSVSGSVGFRALVEPVRQFLERADASEARFMEAECTSIDHASNKVHLKRTSRNSPVVDEIELDYDFLVVAMGARTATFNIKGIEQNSVFLRDVGDAREIRDRIIDSMEAASLPGKSSEEVERLLHFCVVGGGPAGVELCASVQDVLENDLSDAFPHLRKKIKVTLIEAMPRILSTFSEDLVDFTIKKFQQKGLVNVLTKSCVVEAKSQSLTVKGKDGELTELPIGLLVWVAGNAARKPILDLKKSIGEKQNGFRNALTVDDHFLVHGTNNVFSIGDCAFTKLPPTAQVATQEGRYLGRMFNSLSDSMNEAIHNRTSLDNLHEKRSKLDKFEYSHKGSFAYVGAWNAIFDSGSSSGSTALTSSGVSTFLAWRAAYLSNTLSWRNRLRVCSDWMSTALFGREVGRG